jgi:death-on-curing protein
VTARGWVPLAASRIIHDRQISRHGGAAGLRDATLLEAGCNRALNRARYDDSASLFDIAAAYAFGIAKAHAFVDGNKRTAFVTAVTFLRLNGYAFRPDPATGVRMMESLAADLADEAQFSAWLQAGSQPI